MKGLLLGSRKDAKYSEFTVGVVSGRPREGASGLLTQTVRCSPDDAEVLKDKALHVLDFDTTTEVGRGKSGDFVIVNCAGFSVLGPLTEFNLGPKGFEAKPKRPA